MSAAAVAVQCPQHGSGVHIVDLIKDNIGVKWFNYYVN